MRRFPVVWDPLQNLWKCHNLGIGGDRAQHVLWRVEHMFLPDRVAVGVIAVGVNDVNDTACHAYNPQVIAEISDTVIACGVKLKQRCPWMSIAIMAILPAAETDWGRESRIAQVNTLIEKGCAERGFLFVPQDVRCWRDDSGEMKSDLLFDGLHLSYSGLKMLGSIYHETISKCFTHHRERKLLEKSNPIEPVPEPVPSAAAECNYEHSIPTIFPANKLACHRLPKKMRKVKSPKAPVPSQVPSQVPSYRQCSKVNICGDVHVSDSVPKKCLSVRSCKLNFFSLF